MENEVAVNDASNLLPMDILNNMEQKAEVATKEGGSGGGNYIPYIQIMQAQSKKRRELKAEEGNVVINSKEPQILPQTFDIFMIACDTVARDFSNEDGVVSTSKVDSIEFQDIKERAEADPLNSHCCYGPEYLLYIPDYGYVVWHATNATLKNALSDLNRAWGKCFSVTTVLIDNKKYQWWGPQLGKCNNVFDLPSKEDIKATYEKWQESLNRGGEKDADTGSREV